jgi:hypothetical protein
VRHFIQFILLLPVPSAVLLCPAIGLADALTDRCAQPSTPEDTEYCANRAPEPLKLRPSFSEQERPGFDQRGFRSTFLDDALNGNPNPIGGGGIGGDLNPSELGAVSPQDRGLLPGIDPTDVIIPTDVK